MSVASVPADWFTTQTLAVHLGVSPRTVQYWRLEGGGPPVTWVGKRPRYRPDDVAAWIAAGSQPSGAAS